MQNKKKNHTPECQQTPQISVGFLRIQRYYYFADCHQAEIQLAHSIHQPILRSAVVHKQDQILPTSTTRRECNTSDKSMNIFNDKLFALHSECICSLKASR